MEWSRISCQKDSSWQQKYSFDFWWSSVHRRHLVKCQDNLVRWQSLQSLGGIHGCSRAANANVEVLGEEIRRKEGGDGEA